MARWHEITGSPAPPVPGVYALFSGHRLLYIGSAVNLRDRCTDHGIGRSWKRPPGRFTATPALRVKVSPEPIAGRWLMREYRLIRRLRPPLNRTATGTGRRRRSHRPGPSR